MSTELTVREQLGFKLMLAFEGLTVPAEMAALIQKRPLGGFTLFRGLNVQSPEQVRALTASLQQLATEAGFPPLLIATDQECGQFMALGEGTTPFAGNMALGATRDVALVQKVGTAVGRELAALGVNINYAPNCDINSNPNNPACGIRSFGDDPELVATMAAAYVSGLQSAGVASTIKHFPGKGDAQVDSHYAMPLIEHSRERLERVELAPFKAAIAADAKLVMTGHFSIPSLTGTHDVPATLSLEVMHDFLRGELGFDGVVITDAFDMKAISQGAGQIVDAIAAFRAQVDLLLLTKDRAVQERLAASLQLALSRRLLDAKEMAHSVKRILGLKQWVSQFAQPALSVVNCAEHQAVARELARRSITLLRDEAGLLPLRPEPSAKIVVVMPQPEDLTPADTSSFVTPTLAAAIRPYHANVTEIIVPHAPSEQEITAVKQAVSDSDLLILGTISASMEPAQARLAQELLSLAVPTVTVALRTPYDLAVYPEATTHLCTYTILRPSMDALAAALFGHAPITGQLPVTIKGVCPIGHGLQMG